MFKRKNIRLENECYTHPSYISLTLCTEGQKQVFMTDEIYNENKTELEGAANKYNEKIWAFCFMPDHLHLLIENTNDGDIGRFVSLYKQKTGYLFKKKTGLDLWQKSFYDHVLRRDEDLGVVIRYIFNNPVRKGLVADFRDYKYLGSLVETDFAKLVEP